MIENLSQKEFKATPKLLRNLRRFGFVYSKHSDAEDTFYQKQFPVYVNKKTVLLIAEILVSVKTGKIKVDVLNRDGTTYAAWYTHPSYYEPMLETIDNKILRKFKIYGIKEKRKK